METIFLQNTAGFVSHGAPDIILGHDGGLSSWKTYLGPRKPFRAIAVLSAHWMEEEITLSGNPHPETIHDFGGFPAELYQMHYPASGSNAVALDLSDRLSGAGWRSRVDINRGLDHGVWIPLMTMLPDCEIPVIPISLSSAMHTGDMFQLGRDLFDIIGNDLFFLASGGVTHNLFEARFSNGEKAPWAEAFDNWTVETVLSENWNDLINYREMAPHGKRNHPTEEHFPPLLAFAGGTSRSKEISTGASLTVPHRGISYYCVSMTGFSLAQNATLVQPISLSHPR
jgi:4,5-DOPA dioxygenase extradiol